MIQASDYDWEDSGIYVFRNKVNGKEYVGKSKRITKRNRNELTALRNDYFHNKHLQSSFNKYGVENFELKTIKNNICPGLLGVYEIFEIAKRDTNNPEIGYNKTLGGEGVYGHKQSQEHKDKISEALIGKKKTKEHCENISKSRKGIVFTEEHCENISKTKKRIYSSGELEIWNKGKTNSEEHCNNVSKTMKRMYSSGELEIWNKGIKGKDSHMSGEKHHQAKINRDDARKIKILKKTTNMTYQQIAEYVPNATKAIVGMVVRGQTWADVKINEDD
jgi:hypothetical protein